MRTTINTAAGIEFTRINNDVNGNPRYVCHFLNLLNNSQIQRIANKQILVDSLAKRNISAKTNVLEDYKIAVKKANKIGGRKYHNKQYGGGIVFQSYNIEDTARRIKELVNAN